MTRPVVDCEAELVEYKRDDEGEGPPTTAGQPPQKGVRMTRKIISTALVATAVSLSAVEAASAHYFPARFAQQEATQFAREAYLEDDSTDYGYESCLRHTSHRVSCLAVVNYEGYDCATRIFTQSSKRSYRYVTTYGTPRCYDV